MDEEELSKFLAISLLIAEHSTIRLKDYIIFLKILYALFIS
ncbi:hypothetical protein [Lysinibacillus sp. SGAir0095]|nr:hypothetical protein [Lysinibacillus sp. SGAir0095]